MRWWFLGARMFAFFVFDLLLTGIAMRRLNYRGKRQAFASYTVWIRLREAPGRRPLYASGAGLVARGRAPGRPVTVYCSRGRQSSWLRTLDLTGKQVAGAGFGPGEQGGDLAPRSTAFG